MNKLQTNTITSLEAAEMVGKDHNKLLRDIRGYEEQLRLSKIGHTEFFQESTYTNSQNKELPCYNITKKGCEFIGNKLTGVKGTEFTAKYINRFHEMEDTIKSGLEGLSTELQAIMMHDKKIQLVMDHMESTDKKVSDVDEDLQTFKKDIPLFALEIDRITKTKNRKVVPLLGGKLANAYKDKGLRTKVYKDLEKQLNREFGTTTFKQIKRSQCDIAIQIINEYKLPLALENEIENANLQINLEV